MTRNDIIRMALEAGFGCDTDGHIFTDNHDGVCDEYLERFASLVAAAERQRIAAEWDWHMYGDTEDIDIGAAIRARSNP